MKDSDIRQVVLSDLERRYKNAPDVLIIEELGLCQGEARVDLAVVNGLIHGFEIKSEQDTLKRLPRQAAIYSRSLDSVTLVVGGRHLDEALKIVPEWWGVVEAKTNKRKISLHEVRSNMDNPALDPEAIIQLIWRDEALEVLRKRGLQKGYVSKAKWVIWDRIIEKLSLNELREEVRNTLKSREHWRFVLQPE